MKSIIALRCPSCGAEISIEKGHETLFCQYCGTKILINDENETTTRHINEAEMIRANTERQIALQQLSLTKVEDKQKKIKFILFMIWGISSLLCAVIGLCIGLNNGFKTIPFIIGIFGALSTIFCLLASFDSRAAKSNTVVSPAFIYKITITNAMERWREQPCAVMSTIFRAQGFRNVQTVPMRDLRDASDRRNEIVDSITINGSEEWEEGDTFSPNATIIISYHSAR